MLISLWHVISRLSNHFNDLNGHLTAKYVDEMAAFSRRNHTRAEEKNSAATRILRVPASTVVIMASAAPPLQIDLYELQITQ